MKGRSMISEQEIVVSVTWEAIRCKGKLNLELDLTTNPVFKQMILTSMSVTWLIYNHKCKVILQFLVYNRYSINTSLLGLLLWLKWSGFCLQMRETQVWSLGWEDPLEKGMATYSSIPAQRIPWTEEPGGLHSIGWQRVGHDWVTNTFTLLV